MNTVFPIRSPRRALGLIAIATATGILAATGAVTGPASPSASASVVTHSNLTEIAPHESTVYDGRSSFIVPVLPDTQFYSRYSSLQFFPKYGTDPFQVQTEWIVQNQDELNMPFTIHVGDVVDQERVTTEWDAAQRAMQILTDGGMTYSVLPGNHDVQNPGARSTEDAASNYRQRFGAAAMQRQAGEQLIGTFQDGLSSAYLFEAEGHTWMSLAIAWNASDDTFAWAQGILDAHPDVPVILSSHAIVNIAEDQMSPAYWWWGDHLFDQLITGNDQVIMTLNGHFHGSTMQTRTNDAGNPVYQILTDYQMAADGGNGIMTLLEFDLTNDRIDVETVSPWVTVKDEDSRSSSDTPVLDGDWQSFAIAFDFAERFGWSDDLAEADGIDLSERAKEIVSEGWDGDASGATRAAPGSAEDYIAVDGTVAHWRFGSVSAGTFDETGKVPDIAGDSPMYRSAVEHTDAPDEVGDVQVTHENTAFYSADAGAMCFENATRLTDGPDRLAYISTEYGAPATFANLTSDTGYTIETFVQLDEDWTEGANRWSSALTRGGTRSWMGVADNSDPGAGAAWLGISSLREYQFSASDDRTRGSYTLWSGEIMQGAWHHVAIVNDPDDRTAVMYVDGVPVLRNANDVAGMVAADYMPWIIGASTWNTEPDHGWHGCIGETRIVDHALDSSEFLTERVDIDGDGPNFTVDTDLTGVKAPDTVVSVLSGSGRPGAEVRVEVDEKDAGAVTVSASGTWTIALDYPIEGAGTTRALAFVQSIGQRDGSPLGATLTIGEVIEWVPSEGDLMANLEGRITVTPNTFEPGATITIAMPDDHEGDEIHAFAFSEPLALGQGTVSGGKVVMTTPSTLPTGEHQIAVYAEGGKLVGWDSAVVTEPDRSPAVDGGGEEGPGGGAAAGGSNSESLAVTGSDVAGIGVLAGLALGALALGVVIPGRRRRSS
ncbi:LamG-like jellyroll fold domain-containing protein [Microbacterium marmarense]|uniref:LamG-like jellyroll fold domain-containing protein n=1 Tax=Microbacterium marmarense TaxID=3122051 RepID=A0ABU8LR23_9MICO